MTLIIAILMTLLVGMFIGVAGTIYVLATCDGPKVPLDVRLDIHPSTRPLTGSTGGPILDYANEKK